MSAAVDDRLNGLRYMLLAFGAALTLAGVIFFFAFNWASLPGLAKLGVVQVGFLGCVLGAVLRQTNLALKQTLLVSAAVLIGVFLAIYGQVYQTGADPWQLFVGWAVLMVPLVSIARVQVGWLLLALVGAVGAVLFVRQHPGLMDTSALRDWLTAVAWALVFGLVGEWIRRKFPAQDGRRPWSRIVCRVMIFGVLGLETIMNLARYDEVWISGPGFLRLAVLLAASAPVLWSIPGLSSAFQENASEEEASKERQQPDVASVGIVGLTWLFVVLAIADRGLRLLGLDDIPRLFVAVVLLVGGSIAMMGLIQKLSAGSDDGVLEDDFDADDVEAEGLEASLLEVDREEAEFEASSETWLKGGRISMTSLLIAIISGVTGTVAVVMFVALMLLVFGVGKSTLFLLAVILGGLAIAGSRLEAGKKTGGAQVLLVLSVAAQAMAAMVVALSDHQHTFGLMAFSGLLYGLLPSASQRFLSAGVFAGALVFETWKLPGSFILVYAGAVALAGVVLGTRQVIAERYQAALRPAAYLAAMLILGMPFLDDFVLEVKNTWSMRMILVMAAVGLSVWAMQETRRMQLDPRIAISAGILMALSLFTTSGILGACFLAGIGLSRRHLALVVLAVLGLAVHLCSYYYLLTITLLEKSGVLLASGILLLGMYWFLRSSKDASFPADREVSV